MRPLVLLLAVVAAIVVATDPANARPRVAVNIEMSGQLTGTNSTAGTFTSRVGSIEDSGTYEETFGIDGDTIDAVKVLTGSQGILVFSVHTFVAFPTPTTVTFHGGYWRILFGTGAYAGIKGGGRPGTATSFADLVAGTVAVSHRGKARLRPRR
jgi:hypothetical protein